MCGRLEYNKSINTLIIPPYFTFVCLSMLITIWGSSYLPKSPHCGSQYKVGFVSFVLINQMNYSSSPVLYVCQTNWPQNHLESLCLMHLPRIFWPIQSIRNEQEMMHFDAKWQQELILYDKIIQLMSLIYRARY